jgi:hypothetical protein
VAISHLDIFIYLLIYLFTAYLATLFLTQSLQLLMTGWSMNNELEVIWKEVAAAFVR